MKDTQPILNLKITTMKKVIKSYMMAIVAVMLVAGFSAFKVVESPKIYQDDLPEDFIPWYFTGDDEDDVNDPTKYTQNPSQAPDCIGLEEVVCEIYAPEGSSGQPDLDAHIDLSDASSSTVEQLIELAMDHMQDNAVVKSFRIL